MPEPTFLARANWPFRPLQERSLEENELWWRHCYVPGGGAAALQEEVHWCVVAGSPGSGMSVALAALKRAEADRSLILEYPVEHWPSAKRAWVPEGNHLAQIMAQAGLVISKLLTAEPSRCVGFTELQREFSRWLLEKFNGPRAFQRWVDGLPPDISPLFHSVPYNDIYPTTTEARDVHGQIDELVNLVRRLGYRRLIVVLDLVESHDNLAQLKELYSWHELMDHPGFAVVAAIPTNLLASADIVRASQGRLSVTHLTWDAAQLRALVTRHLRSGLGESTLQLEDLVVEALWQKIEKSLLTEYGAYLPAGWVAMADSLIQVVANSNHPPALPLKPKHMPNIGREFFSRYMPIRLDRVKHGVWRGPKFIPLTDQPLALLTRLYASAGQPVDSEELRVISGSSGNLYSIATRLRKTIEPFPDQPIYFHHSRGEGGYWLENFTRLR